jgi:hypothetical protein
MEDMNQQQKICITPINEESNLLRAKPKDWNVIKNKKFMIINNQHNIAVSKELQIEGCRKDKCRTLEKWKAYIVWDLDPV